MMLPTVLAGLAIFVLGFASGVGAVVVFAGLFHE